MIVLPTDENIQKAASIISAGGVVVFPTETVYGMGADLFHHFRELLCLGRFCETERDFML